MVSESLEGNVLDSENFVKRIEFDITQLKKKNKLSFVEHVAAVALLHNVLEDTDVGQTRLFDLVMECGWSSNETNAIVHDVSLLTRLSKSQPILDYLRGIKGGSFAATIVKRADIEHNLSDLKPGNLRDKYHLCLNFLE
jgi:hypothetical protein